jgi:hypothetical protein
MTSGLLSGSAEITLAITFSEEWAAGPVDQAAGQDFLFVRTAFAPEVIAGDTSGGVVGLAVFNCQWEEINTFTRYGSANGSNQQHSVAITEHT